ncbi:MAG: trypsin-like peptidase domain-containing protein [Phycisphaerae bacterium]
MRIRLTRVLLVGLCLAALGGGGAVCAAEGFGLAALREKAGPCTCLVTAQNALGLPLGCATGFLIGKGRFVATDLATLAQPGVVRAVLRFDDGVEEVAWEFGLADPVLGVAVIRREENALERSGLHLSPQPVNPEEGRPVAAVGWQWGDRMQVGRGQLRDGLSARELAEVSGTAAPTRDVKFLGFNSPVLEGTAGAPVVDGAGDVVGMLLAVKALPQDVAVVVPAAALREALLSAKPELKCFPDLPEPLWPVQVQQVAGKPIHPGLVGRSVRACKTRLRCPRCNGSGQVSEKRFSHWERVGGMSRAVYKMVPVTCPTCQGETAVWKDAHYASLATIGEQGTQLVYGPGVEAQTRAAVRGQVAEFLGGLSKVGERFRRQFDAAGAAAVAKAKDELPAGLVLYAQVRETVDGPDGRYTLLAPHWSSVLFVVRHETFGPTSDEIVHVPDATWRYGKWLVLAGRAEKKLALPGRELIYFRPAAWASGPHLGDAPSRPPNPQPLPPLYSLPTRATKETPRPGTEPKPPETVTVTKPPEPGKETTKPPEKKPEKKSEGDGEPDFFGL